MSFPELAFTRYSFVDSGSVHQLILFLALDTSFIAPPLYFSIDIGQYMVSPKPHGLPFNMQYWYWYSNLVQRPIPEGVGQLRVRHGVTVRDELRTGITVVNGYLSPCGCALLAPTLLASMPCASVSACSGVCAVRVRPWVACSGQVKQNVSSSLYRPTD